MQRVLASVVIASIAFGAAAAQVAAPAPTAPAAKTEGAPPVPAAPPRAPAASRPQPTLLGDGPWDVATEQQKIHVTVVTKGLDHPWGLAFVPNGDMLVTERDGRLRVIRKGVLDPTPIAGLP
jgi:glucose/arabinose dehydrogenase